MRLLSSRRKKLATFGNKPSMLERAASLSVRQLSHDSSPKSALAQARALRPQSHWHHLEGQERLDPQAPLLCPWQKNVYSKKKFIVQMSHAHARLICEVHFEMPHANQALPALSTIIENLIRGSDKQSRINHGPVSSAECTSSPNRD